MNGGRTCVALRASDDIRQVCKHAIPACLHSRQDSRYMPCTLPRYAQISPAAITGPSCRLPHLDRQASFVGLRAFTRQGGHPVLSSYHCPPTPSIANPPDRVWLSTDLFPKVPRSTIPSSSPQSNSHFRTVATAVRKVVLFLLGQILPSRMCMWWCAFPRRSALNLALPTADYPCPGPALRRCAQYMITT